MIDSDGRARTVAMALVGLLGALTLSGATAAVASSGTAAAKTKHPFAGTTATPIKHVIVIIGENHTFDNVFATYRAPGRQHVRNLLSEGIVTASGAPRGSGG